MISFVDRSRDRPRGFLITGTDTGVGKTFIGCGVAAALHRKGLRVAPFKPAETGCKIASGSLIGSSIHSGELIPADAVLLRMASETNAPLDAICPYRFPLPVAPWVAAQAAGQQIEVSVLTQRFEELASTHDVVLVESAGGILVPLAEEFHFGNLAKMLGLPVLVIAGSKLGVISHTLLTLEYLRTFQLSVLGCVLNHPYPATDPKDRAEHGAAIETNAAALRTLAGTRIFVVPSESDAARAEIHAEVERIATHILVALGL